MSERVEETILPKVKMKELKGRILSLLDQFVNFKSCTITVDHNLRERMSYGRTLTIVIED